MVASSISAAVVPSEAVVIIDNLGSAGGADGDVVRKIAAYVTDICGENARVGLESVNRTKFVGELSSSLTLRQSLTDININSKTMIGASASSKDPVRCLSTSPPPKTLLGCLSSSLGSEASATAPASAAGTSWAVRTRSDEDHNPEGGGQPNKWLLDVDLTFLRVLLMFCASSAATWIISAERMVHVHKNKASVRFGDNSASKKCQELFMDTNPDLAPDPLERERREKAAAYFAENPDDYTAEASPLTASPLLMGCSTWEDIGGQGWDQITSLSFYVLPHVVLMYYAIFGGILFQDISPQQARIGQLVFRASSVVCVASTFFALLIKFGMLILLHNLATFAMFIVAPCLFDEEIGRRRRDLEGLEDDSRFARLPLIRRIGVWVIVVVTQGPVQISQHLSLSSGNGLFLLFLGYFVIPFYWWQLENQHHAAVMRKLHDNEIGIIRTGGVRVGLGSTTSTTSNGRNKNQEHGASAKKIKNAGPKTGAASTTILKKVAVAGRSTSASARVQISSGKPEDDRVVVGDATAINVEAEQQNNSGVLFKSSNIKMNQMQFNYRLHFATLVGLLFLAVLPIFNSLAVVIQTDFSRQPVLKFLLWHFTTIFCTVLVYVYLTTIFRGLEPSLTTLLSTVFSAIGNMCSSYQIFRMGLRDADFFTSFAIVIVLETYRDTYLLYHVDDLTNHVRTKIFGKVVSRLSKRTTEDVQEQVPEDEEDGANTKNAKTIREVDQEADQLRRGRMLREKVVKSYTISRWNTSSGLMEIFSLSALLMALLLELFVSKVVGAQRYADVPYLLGVDYDERTTKLYYSHSDLPDTGSTSTHQSDRIDVRYSASELGLRFGGLLVLTLAEGAQVWWCDRWNQRRLVAALQDLVSHEVDVHANFSDSVNAAVVAAVARQENVDEDPARRVSTKGDSKETARPQSTEQEDGSLERINSADRASRWKKQKALLNDQLPKAATVLHSVYYRTHPVVWLVVAWMFSHLGLYLCAIFGQLYV